MPMLKKFRCKDCGFEFSDEVVEGERGDINPNTGAIDNKKPIPYQCPNCESSNVERVQGK